MGDGKTSRGCFDRKRLERSSADCEWKRPLALSIHADAPKMCGTARTAWTQSAGTNQRFWQVDIWKYANFRFFCSILIIFTIPRCRIILIGHNDGTCVKKWMISESTCLRQNWGTIRIGLGASRPIHRCSEVSTFPTYFTPNGTVNGTRRASTHSGN